MENDDTQENQSMDTPESTSFVPPSLASFISKAQETLDDVQHSLQFDSPLPNNNKNNTSAVSMDQDTSFVSMKEDEDDKKLKQHVLDKINERNKTETGVEKSEKEFDPTSMLLELAEAAYNESESLPEKTTKTLESPEKVMQSVPDFLSGDVASEPSPVKSVASPSSASNTADPKRDSGSSRASGWKKLLASVPSPMASSPASAVKTSPKKRQASPAAGNEHATLLSSVKKHTEPSTAKSASLPKDTLTSPSIPSSIDPMAMSAALEVTSPLQVAENPQLSASTPELAPPSPWKSAFKSMVARLEDRVTPPTPEQSPVFVAKQSPPKDLTSDPVSTSVAPSPVVANSSPEKSRQNEPPAKVAQRKSGLILSPSDSLPPQSVEKSNVAASPAASLPKESQVARKSGLVLSPSDSLPAPSPAEVTTRQSGLVLSPSDSLPPKAVPQSAKKALAPSPPVARQSGLVLSPSDSLPATFPSTEKKRKKKASPNASLQSPEKEVAPVPSPAAFASPHSTGRSSTQKSPLSKVSSSSTEKNAAISLPTPSPVTNAKTSKQKSPPVSSPPPVAVDKTLLPQKSEKKTKKASPQKPPVQAATKDGKNPPPVALSKSPSSDTRTSGSTAPKAASSSPVVVEPVAAPKNAAENKTASSSRAQPAPPQQDKKPAKQPTSVEQVTTSQPPQVQRVSKGDDAFLPCVRSLVSETPPTRRPVQTSKSEASKRVTQPRASANTGVKSRKSLPITKRSVDRQRVPPSSAKAAATRKTPSASSTGSRLFQGTASSQAHAKAPIRSSSKPTPTTRTTSSRLTQGTAASEARAKLASPTPKPVAVRKQAPVEDGRAKARERVRQQKLAAEKKRKEAAEAAKKEASRSRVCGATRSADEGRALARERVKQQQATAQARASSVKGKENQVRTTNQTAKAAAAAVVPSSRRRHTIPKSPNFATKAVLGKPRERSVGGSGGSMKLDPNPISRAAGSPTQSDRTRSSTNRTSTGSTSSRRLTVPKAPRLSTSAKYGDKPPPSLRETKPLKPISQPKPPPRKREYKPTQPVPFKFHSSKTAACESTAAKEAEPSLAEQVELFSRKGLRQEYSATSSSVKRTYKPTIPKSPNFSAISQKARPKSTAEKEEEMMEYYREHPFKAAPIGDGVPTATHTGPSKQQAPKRSLAQPKQFRLRADDRAAQSTTAPIGSLDPEAKDLEECKKQFHARPLPRTLNKPPPPRKKASYRTLTTPKPFTFSTDKRIHSEPHGPSEDEIEMSKQFHARPMPKTTYVDPRNRSRPAVATPTPTKYAGPPKLATSARTEPREASILASQKNAEQLARQKELLALRKQQEKHQEDMAKASLTSPPPNIEPFHLASEARHEAYQRQLAEQLAQEEEEAKEKMVFTAKPLRLSDPPSPIHSNKATTTPQPFPLRSLSRHERWREERRQQLEAEERERQRLMNVKAIPVPETTYKYSPVTPASQKKKRSEESEIDLDSARKRAMEALECAENQVQEGNAIAPARSLMSSLMGSK